MKSFSQRLGITPIKSNIQIDSIDNDLRNSLWNALCIHYLNKIEGYIAGIHDGSHEFIAILWVHYFKNRIDECPEYARDHKKIIKKYFFECEYYEVYNILEFFPNNFNPNYRDYRNEEFTANCNLLLERELSAYRFIDKTLCRITSTEEIESINEALNVPDKFAPVKDHLKRSLELFSDKKKPDYRNSIKESISAVESYCSILTAKPNSTLGQALKEIEKYTQIHPALKNAFSSLYGYTSDSDGIRHALIEKDNLKSEDAKFMLISCSAFINYLREKEK